MPKKNQPINNEELNKEEQEVVDFLVQLIPVLQEIQIDLEKKGLLPEELCRSYLQKKKSTS